MEKKPQNTQRSKMALLLTGGGARAAYQVGVLKALALSMPRNARIPFQVINGTSAGAINSAAMACYASCMHLAVRKIEWVWRNFHTHMVYKSSFSGATSYIIGNMLRSFQSDYLKQPPASLLDNSPLRTLLNDVLDLSRIDRNLHRQYLDAISVTVSSYSTGKSVAVFQSNTATPWQRAKREGIADNITLDLLMASSAIPMIFPSVRVKHHYYGDGSIHQLSPLSPSIHLGADKIFIIGVEQPERQRSAGYEPNFPGVSTVAGHLLDSVFSDTLQSDIERLKRVNRTIGLLPSNSKSKHKELKQISTLVINPTQNFNELAAECYECMPLAVRTLLRTIGVKKDSDSSLASYLMFEKAYTRKLIDFGYQDGLSQLDEIRTFLELN